ncbi:hypothetical protein [Sinomonas halotolerans]|uniref:Uncharacterized protein n=1 Tax=Sinomonas halotolerans TaxID=1644133 RepID=A0ABU9X434_9MICC
MALVPVARARALTALRHAAAAAGLGLGWLLLSAPAASALDDLLGADSLLGAPTAPTAELAPVDTVGRTTTMLASVADAAAPAAHPLLTGPLEPLAPVVGGVVSEIGDAVTAVGDVVGALPAPSVSVPIPLPEPLPLPALPPSVLPVAPPAAPAPAVSPAAPAAPGSAPVLDTAPVLAPPAGEGTGPAAPGDGPRATLESGRVWDWSMPVFSLERPAELGPAAERLPSGAPGGPWAIPLFERQLWLGSGLAGASGAGAPGAVLAAAVLLPALLQLTARNRPRRAHAPASPAFQPGSTPD